MRHRAAPLAASPSGSTRSYTSLLLFLLIPLMLVLPARLVAQGQGNGSGGGSGGGGITPMCEEGCLPDYEVRVTPDGGTPEPAKAPQTTGHVKVFSVYNYGLLADTYSLSCSASGPLTCDSLSASSVNVKSKKTAQVNVWYSAGNPGNGTLALHAAGESVDSGYVSVPVSIPSTAPAVSLAPFNGAVRDYSACLASCFAKVVGHVAPAYVTLDVPRSFGLVYSSATVKPTPVVQVDVTAPSTGSAASADVYEIELRHLATGALITQLNGATSSFHERGSSTTRVSAAFDARANGMTTSGAWPVKVVVIARDTVTSAFSTTTLVTTVPVAVRIGGPYGDGVWPAGVPQLVTSTGLNNSAAIIEADGSVFYYQKSGSTWQIPGGTDAAFNGVRRTFKDGSYQEFSAGNLSKVVDPYGNTTNLWWTGNRIDSIVDPMGKKLSLTYNGSGKLQELSDPGSRETGYIVDGSNQLTRITDPDGEYTEYSYDSNGLLTQVRGRNLATWKTTWDVMNRVATDSAPAVLLHDGTTKRPTVVYTAPELAAWQPGTAGTSAGTAKPDITGADVLATLRDPLGAEVDYEVNRFGSPVKIYEPLARVTTLTRDTANRVTYSLAPNGNTVTAEYGVSYYPPTGSPDDPFVLRETENHVTDAVVTYLYNSQHKVARVWGTGVDVQQDFTYYSSFAGGGAPGALKQVKLGGSSTASATYYYDGLGRDTAVVDAEGHRTRKVYHTATGNLKETYDALGNRTRFHFDALGRTDSVYLPTGAVTGTAYGVLNQVTASRDPLGHVVTTEYNTDLTVKRIVDAKNQVYKFSYNALGWPVARFDLADTTKADSTWYDAAGRPRRTKTRRGNVLGAQYDVLGRLTLQTYRRPGISVDSMYASFAYDSVGRRVVASNWIGKDTLLYDNAGRLTEHRMRQGAELFKFTYQYDTKSRLVSRSLMQNANAINEAYLSRTWSSWGQLSQTSAAGVTVRMDRTGADSMPTKRVINPGTAGSWWISSVFDDDHQFVRDSFDVAALDGKFGKAVERDSLGRLTSVEGSSELFGDFVYRYDIAGQLLQACRKFGTGGTCVGDYGFDAVEDTPYRYDAAGNRTDSLANAVIGAGNRTEEFKGWTLTYDADGNVISKANGTDTWTYTWDPYNKLTEVAKNGTVELRYMYDAFGSRVIRCFNASCSSAERLVNDGDQLVLARNGTGPITDIYGYYPGGDHPLAVQFQSGKKLVYITDPQLNATVRGLADTNRTATNPLVKDYTIGPWGEVAADTGLKTRLKLAGQQYDQEVGLYYMRARYYDPALGRFLSEDPIGIAGGLNLYAYAGNDPVNMWDPTGLDPAGGDPCTTKDGSPGKLNKQGKCEPTATVTIPDIQVHTEPPTDVVTIQRGQRSSGSRGGATYQAKAGQRVVFSGLVGNAIFGAGFTGAIGTYSYGMNQGWYFRLGAGTGFDISAGFEAGQSTSRESLNGIAEAVCAGYNVLNACLNSSTQSIGLAVGPSEALASGHTEWAVTLTTAPRLLTGSQLTRCLSASTGLGPYCR
jgi:RHS repeat-associated protein